MKKKKRERPWRRLACFGIRALVQLLIIWSIHFFIFIVFPVRPCDQIGLAWQRRALCECTGRGQGRSGDSSASRASAWIPGAILTRVRVPGSARVCFSPRVNFQCSLSDGVRTAPVCNCIHPPTSVRTLKIPDTGSHTIVWTQDNTAHTDRNG